MNGLHRAGRSKREPAPFPAIPPDLREMPYSPPTATLRRRGNEVAAMNMKRVIGAAMALLGVALARPSVASEWLLLSHTGECAAIEALKRKLPSMPPVHTPDELESYLKKDRLEYSRKVHPGEPGELNEFRVPAAGLSIVLVPRQQCKKILPGPR